MKYLIYPALMLMGMTFSINTQNPILSTRVLADFEAEKLVIEQGQKIRFLDKSKGNPVQWSWNFENGFPAKALESDPEVYYPKAGYYDVTITVSDGETFDTKVMKDYVKVNGLIHHFRFDGLVRDEVNLNHGLGLMNKWTLARDRKGATNRALLLRPDSYATLADRGEFKTNELTISLWMKTPKRAAQRAVILEKYGDQENDFGFRLLMTDGQISFEGSDGSGLLRSTGSSIDSFDDDQWHQITAVMTSNSHWQLWVDGILRAEQINSYTISEQFNQVDLTIGFSQISEYKAFEGVIDDLKIFNKALNMQAIVKLSSE
ncbi:MAG: PKD domain-containing protein [Cytophagia bacterium]|nr:PKD domain-containing protein [Cytophagia bacterium]